MIAADSARPLTPPDGGGDIGSAASNSSSRAGQRRRLLEAAVELVASAGYPRVRIGDLARSAGVSRATFYEHFRDKEDCFLAAYDELAEGLIARVQDAPSGKSPGNAGRSVVGAIVRYAVAEPAAFSFLTYEAALAGPKALARRDRLIGELAQPLERPAGATRRGASPLRVPAWVLLGGVVREIGMQMRRGDHPSERLTGELADWIDSYRSAPRRDAQRLHAQAHGVNVRGRPTAGPVAPQPLPRGRHRLPRDVVRRVQRERILHATAHVITAKGYSNTTVADIVASAGVSREVFYSHFRSRSQAYLETHQLVFEQLMATTAGAFFAAAGPWPEQIWQAAQAATRFVLDAPSLAYFAFVESYALGSSIAPRTDEAVLAFTVLLAKGYSMRPDGGSKPHVTSDAIIAATMEAVAFYLRDRREDELVDLLPMMTYLVITPFVGAKDAEDFIRGKLRERDPEVG